MDSNTPMTANAFNENHQMLRNYLLALAGWGLLGAASLFYNLDRQAKETFNTATDAVPPAPTFASAARP
jgi:hypothetical protein